MTIRRTDATIVEVSRFRSMISGRDLLKIKLQCDDDGSFVHEVLYDPSAPTTRVVDDEDAKYAYARARQRMYDEARKGGRRVHLHLMCKKDYWQVRHASPVLSPTRKRVVQLCKVLSQFFDNTARIAAENEP